MVTRMVSMLAAVALLLAACGKSSQEKAIEKAIEKQSGGKANVDLSKNKMTIQTKEGGKMEFAGGGEGLKVPEDFPKDIYVYQGAKVEQSIKTQDGTQLTLETADPIAKVAEEYKGRMKKEGWEEKTAAMMGQLTMLEYGKDQRSLMVHITSDGKKTMIMLMMTKEQKSGK